MVFGASLLITPGSLLATERKFAFSYEVTTAPKGTVELENWVTWKHSDNAAGKVDRFDFRHELEFGVTDRLQAAVYLVNWTYDDRATDKRAHYENSGIELIYNLTNPTTDFLGSALYLEALVGDENLEVEGKLLLQKNFGPVVVAYNAVLEAEWEGEKLDERTGEFAQTLGISYELNRNFSLGAEVLHEVEFPDWGEAEEGRVWAGPNISLRSGRVSAVLAGLFQVTDVDEEPDVQTRLIFGVTF
jgi:hypothetical protein